jgi:hypothetical protein
MLLCNKCGVVEIEDYFRQVRQAASSSLYFVALGAALVIPDMCSSMESADGQTTGALYENWFDKHVARHYTAGSYHTPSFSGKDCYGLRCAFLHQGRLEPHKGGYSRIIFIEPHSGPTLHNNVMNDALNIDVPTFALGMVAAAEAWLGDASTTEEFKENYPHFMQRYPNGLPPYIVGIPVIA